MLLNATRSLCVVCNSAGDSGESARRRHTSGDASPSAWTVSKRPSAGASVGQ